MCCESNRWQEKMAFFLRQSFHPYQMCSCCDKESSMGSDSFLVFFCGEPVYIWASHSSPSSIVVYILFNEVQKLFLLRQYFVMINSFCCINDLVTVNGRNGRAWQRENKKKRSKIHFYFPIHIYKKAEKWKWPFRILWWSHLIIFGFV